MTNVIQRNEKIENRVEAIILGDYCKVDLYANEREVCIPTVMVEEGEISPENPSELKAINIDTSTDDVFKYVYEYDFTRFSFNINEFNHTLEEIRENPEKFIGFEDNVTLQREKAFAAIQKWNDNKTNEKCVLPSQLGFSIEYSPKALSLIQGIMLMMLGGMMTETSWTDSNDIKHEHLTLDEVKMIGAIFASYVMQIQETADNAREQVRQALSSAELKEIEKNFKNI